MSDKDEELDIDLGDDESTEVELEDEASPEESSDRGKPPKDAAPKEKTPPEPSSTEGPSKEGSGEEDELDSYSRGVQKRIRQLTQRNRETAEREAEATRVAQQLYQQNQELNTRLRGLDRGYLTEYGGRLEAQLERVKREYREAYDEGDTDKMFTAQQALSQIAIEQERHKLASARQQQVQEDPAGNQATQTQTQTRQPQTQPATPPDPKAQAWAEQNEWFGADETMTYAAFGVHRRLVQDEGFDPQSEEYYKEIDARMRTEFPHKFRKAPNGKAAPVAPGGNSASRNTTTGRRQVKLTSSQVAIANKLGVPLSEYAKYVKG